LIPHGFHAAAAACSRVQRKVPSTHMRCMITANRRAPKLRKVPRRSFSMAMPITKADLFDQVQARKGFTAVEYCLNERLFFGL
jgi:hypothetical protein